MKRTFHFGEEKPHRSEAQRSGFGSERRSNEAIRSFRGPYGNRGNGVSEVCDDEVGVNDDEGPPVPIPNTEVKLVGGENTCLATDREDSTMPTQRQQLQTTAAVIFISVARQVFSDRFQSKRLLRLEKEEAVPQNQHETAVSCWRGETAK